MNIKQQLDDTMKVAMRARDNLRLSTVRMVKSAIKNREIEQKKELDDKAIIDVLSTLVKQRRESIRLYQEGNRPELADKEEQELSVLLEFMPSQLSPEELETIVRKAILESGAESAKDIGKVMKLLTPETAGKADGKSVSDLVRTMLS